MVEDVEVEVKRIGASRGRRFEFDPKGFFYIYLKHDPTEAMKVNSGEGSGGESSGGEGSGGEGSGGEGSGGEIVVEHYINVQKEGSRLKVATGRLNTVIRGTDALGICDTVFRKGLVSRLDHAMYLGRELQRAQCALETGRRYEQDELDDTDNQTGEGGK